MNKPHAHIYSAEIHKWIAGTLKLPTAPEPARGMGVKELDDLMADSNGKFDARNDGV